MPYPSWSSVLVQQLKPDNADPMVIMGKIVAAQGIQGWVKVQAFTEYLDALLDYQTWYLGSATKPWREINVVEGKPHNKVLVARLEGVDDRTAAEKLRGLLVGIPRSKLPEASADEYYWSDLIGMRVENLQGEFLGNVDHLLDMGANDILVVKNEGVEILIPFLAHVVQQVEMETRLIRVDWQADY
jgi:16S rRNA processing protein RimM